MDKVWGLEVTMKNTVKELRDLLNSIPAKYDDWITFVKDKKTNQILINIELCYEEPGKLGRLKWNEK